MQTGVYTHENMSYKRASTFMPLDTRVSTKKGQSYSEVSQECLEDFVLTFSSCEALSPTNNVGCHTAVPMLKMHIEDTIDIDDEIYIGDSNSIMP